jgi:hypothetical protein
MRHEADRCDRGDPLGGTLWTGLVGLKVDCAPGLGTNVARRRIGVGLAELRKVGCGGVCFGVGLRFGASLTSDQM